MFETKINMGIYYFQSFVNFDSVSESHTLNVYNTSNSPIYYREIPREKFLRKVLKWSPSGARSTQVRELLRCTFGGVILTFVEKYLITPPNRKTS